MAKIKEIKRLDVSKVRQKCINNGWYNNGTNKEYSRMFAMCQKDNITVSQLYKIARDIYQHTNVTWDTIGACPDGTSEDNILNIMCYLNDCAYTFYQMV